MADLQVAVQNEQDRTLEKTRAVAKTADFSSTAEYIFDFVSDYFSGNVPGFQSVYVDNSQNDNDVALYVQGSEQTVYVPGNWQGVFPIYAPQQAFVRVTSTASANQITKLLFLTFRQPYYAAPATNASGVGAATAANQVTQIARATTANDLLQDILDALTAGGGDATAANQVIGNDILADLLTQANLLATNAQLVTATNEIEANGITLASILSALAGTLLTKPVMANGGNIEVQTSAIGTNFATFAAQACVQLTIKNDSGTDIEFRQGGAGVEIKIADGDAFTVMGITNANQIGVKRVDDSNTQVFVQARWES